MREIQLNKRSVNKGTAIVDDEDYERVSKYNWTMNKGAKNKTAYAICTVGTAPNRIRIYMHRLIMNAPPGTNVDHINHNTLDNRKENLRVGTQHQNLLNKLPCGKSKYKGVSLYSNGKYVAHYMTQHIGYFESEIDAALAYNSVAFCNNSEWALLNIIPGYTEEQLVTMPTSYAPRIATNNYRGVRAKTEHCFEASIQHGVRYVIGYYPTEMEAAIAYNKECDKLNLPNRKNIFT